MFGAIYRIVPLLTGHDFPSPRLVKVHFALALAGIGLVTVPLAIGGILEGIKLQDPQHYSAFLDIARSTLPFLRASTAGELLIAGGHLIFFVNVVGLVNRYCKAQTAAAIAVVTEDLYKEAGVKA
jgi:cytochrome c oxidase cbb3-type subunit 1